MKTKNTWVTPTLLRDTKVGRLERLAPSRVLDTGYFLDHEVSEKET